MSATVQWVLWFIRSSYPPHIRAEDYFNWECLINILSDDCNEYRISQLQSYNFIRQQQVGFLVPLSLSSSSHLLLKFCDRTSLRKPYHTRMSLLKKVGHLELRQTFLTLF